MGEAPRAFPREPMEWFVQLHQLARSGRVVEAGDVTQFGARKLLDRHLIYVPAQPLPAVEIPPSALAAILVTEEEVVAAQETGPTRVMARLGFAARYYPCPPWSDRDRPGLPMTATAQASVLGRMPRLRCRGLSAVNAGKQLHIRLTPEARQWGPGLAQMPAESAWALLVDLDPTANACLVWEPGQTEQGAIIPPGSDGSRVSGCYLAIAAEQDETSINLFEDGFSLLLTNEARDTLVAALTGGRSASLDAADGACIIVEWVGG